MGVGGENVASQARLGRIRKQTRLNPTQAGRSPTHRLPQPGHNSLIPT